MAVDDFVQNLRGLRVVGHLPCQRVGRGVEKPPSVATTPVMRRVLICPQNIRNGRHIYCSTTIERHDCVVDLIVGQLDGLVPGKLRVLPFPLRPEWLHDAGDDAGQFVLKPFGVTPGDDCVTGQSEIVTDEDPRSEADACREALRVVVAKRDGVGEVAIVGPQREQAEVAVSLGGNGVMFLDHLVTEVSEREFHHIHQRGVGEWMVGRGCGGSR